jgi:phosphatidylcholine synthase
MSKVTKGQRLTALSVHLFTASGMVTGFFALVASTEGDFRTAMIWLMISFLIDGIDGTFARMARVKEVLPEFDGKNIDYVIDFATYAIIPTYMMYKAGLYPEGWEMAASGAILLTSAMYYGREGMVSDNMQFIGFPVMWNLIAFYLIMVVQLPAWANLALVALFCILHFVPLKFAYPSRSKRFGKLHIAMSVVLAISLAGVLLPWPQTPEYWNYICLSAGIYFLVMSVVEMFD